MSTISLRDHLQAIRDEHGVLNPELVVDTASNPEHPLHAHFEWDDSVAAKKWRLDQAGQMLRLVKLPPNPAHPSDLRAFMGIRGKDTNKADYVPTGEVMADPFLRELVLRDAKREARIYANRYKHLAEFAEIVQREILGEAS